MNELKREDLEIQTPGEHAVGKNSANRRGDVPIVQLQSKRSMGLDKQQQTPPEYGNNKPEEKSGSSGITQTKKVSDTRRDSIRR